MRATEDPGGQAGEVPIVSARGMAPRPGAGASAEAGCASEASPRCDGAVGFVGLGAMGAPMARHLADAGVPLLVYDSDPAKLDQARLEKLAVAHSLTDFDGAHVAVCMLPNSDAVEQVVLGTDGLLDVLAAGTQLIDMGSSDPSRTVRLAERCRARGVELVDAPVSGGVAGAQRGDLTIMFGGSDAQLARAHALLMCMGSTVLRVGDVGAGHALKALNNVMSAVGLSIACEAIEVGCRFGLDPRVMLDVLNRSTGRNHATETKIEQFVLSERYASGFLLRLMVKDLDTAVRLARDLGANTPLSDACLELWQEAAEALPIDADQTRIAEVLRGTEYRPSAR